jgi:hypothetical protein
MVTILYDLRVLREEAYRITPFLTFSATMAFDSCCR